ncbi:MAG: hypothetical protein ACK4NC_00980 [Candidatus Gracilibacteria bacterium]
MTYKQKVYILQVAIAFIFAWFGVEKLLFPESWALFVPSWFTTYVKINVTQLVLLCGAAETVLALWILIPWKTHWAAYTAFVYFILIISVTGISHAGIRDISLALSTLSLALFTTPPKIDLHFSR